MNSLKPLTINVILTLTICLFPVHLPAEIYEYKNSTGRTVYSQRPDGVKREETQESVTSGNVSAYCRQKWGKDFEMLEYCLDKQREARHKLNRYPDDILQFCKNKWHNNFEMMEHCAKKQYSAKLRLGQ